MKTYILRICSFLMSICLWCIQIFPVYGANYGGALEDSININDTANEQVRLIDRFQDRAIDIWGSEEVRDFIAWIAIKILIPVFTFAGVIVAIIWFYKLMASEWADDITQANRYILWWITGIILMVSAGYITNQLVGTEWITAIFGEIGNFSNDRPAGAVIAEQLYVNIWFPFIRLMFFFVMGILFITATISAFQYIFANGEEVQKKSTTILIYSAMGIIVTILAKTMVEAVYGDYTDVINASVAQWSGEDIGQIGNGIFEAPDFLNLQTAVNRALWLASFIILIILIYQGYQLLVNPSDEETVTKLKKSMGYIFLGILVIGAGYLITNFFIIT